MISGPVELHEEDAERISGFLRPLYAEIYSDKVVGGKDAVMRIFDRWNNPEAVRRRMGSGTVYLMWSDDGRDVCLLAMQVLPDGVLYLDKLYTAPEARGSGLGSAAMEHAFGYARSRGCDIVTTHINAANAGALRFYGRHGLRCVATTRRSHDGGEYGYSYLVGIVPGSDSAGTVADRGRASRPSRPSRRGAPERLRSPPSRTGPWPAGRATRGSTGSET